jgi:hypothetical protein
MKPETIQKWRDKLETLLARAEAAASEPLSARLAIAKQLQAFILDNPATVDDDPDTAVFTALDDIATQAHDALLLAALEERIAGIASRSAELAGLEKKISAQSAANEKAAKSIRLEKATQVVNSVTAAVNSIKDLKTAIEANPSSTEDFEALVKKLADAMATLQDVRAAVEASG